jgi:hypothetical protein
MISIVDQTLVPHEDLVVARFQSGFGCIRCGATIVHYCTQAQQTVKSPNLEEIFLLCPHCFDQLNRQAQADHTLLVLRSNPLPLQHDFAKLHLPYSPSRNALDLPDVALGGRWLFHRVSIPMILRGLPVVAVEVPEIPGGALVMDITLCNAAGDPVRVVVGNEWVAPAGWSFHMVHNRYVIEGPGVELSLRYDASKGLDIDRLVIQHAALPVEITRESMTFKGEPLTVPPARNCVVGFMI